MVRADARENRERILVVAKEAFAADGAVSMNRVAQLAGVGAGTLYRHYPRREDLVLAVFRSEVDRLAAEVPRLLADHPPVEALRAWVLQLVAAMRAKHGLGDALSAAGHRAVVDDTQGPVLEALGTLLDAGRRGGVVRDDADPLDLLQLTAALWRAPAEPEDRAPALLDLVLDGLAPRSAAAGPDARR